MEMARVLVVEDDDAIGTALTAVLEGAGYRVSRTPSGAAALRAVDDDRPDVVLLDLGLPDMDGVDVCRRLRRGCTDLAIVVVTARDDEMDVVLGLNAGADDYITKPFRLGELQARLTAVLRRAPVPAGRTLAVGDVEIDPAARTARRDGNVVELRPREFDLLLLLASNAGRVVARERILAELWRDPWGEASKTLDMHISTLRRRLGDPDPITTLRGVGYRLDAA
jgi:DNA-binding response OmpR family regulator